MRWELQLAVGVPDNWSWFCHKHWRPVTVTCVMMRGVLHSSWRSKPYLAALYSYVYTSIRLLSWLGGNIAHAVNCQVIFPRATPVISRTRLSPSLFYYGFKGHLLYARRENEANIAV